MSTNYRRSADAISDRIQKRVRERCAQEATYRLEDETAREDIVNALAIIVGMDDAGTLPLCEDMRAIRRRLESAIAKMDRQRTEPDRAREAGAL